MTTDAIRTCVENAERQVRMFSQLLNAYSGHLCYLWFQFSHAEILTVWP